MREPLRMSDRDEFHDQPYAHLFAESGLNELNGDVTRTILKQRHAVTIDFDFLIGKVPERSSER